PAHRVAYRPRRRRVLRARFRGGAAAVRAVRHPLRHPRPRRVGRQHRGAVPVPPVDLLHGLPVPARRRGRRDIRPRAHAALAAGAARLTSTVLPPPPRPFFLAPTNPPPPLHPIPPDPSIPWAPVRKTDMTGADAAAKSPGRIS